MEPLLPGDPWGRWSSIYWLCGRHEVLATVGGLDELAEELLVEPASWLAEVVADRIRAHRCQPGGAERCHLGPVGALGLGAVAFPERVKGEVAFSDS